MKYAKTEKRSKSPHFMVYKFLGALLGLDKTSIFREGSWERGGGGGGVTFFRGGLQFFNKK